MQSANPLYDHHRIERLAANLQDAFEANASEDTQLLWRELQRAVDAHLQAEEEFLFPRFERVDATETRALRADHQALRRQLARLTARATLQRPLVAAFFQLLREHAAREDAMLYRWADAALLEEERLIEEAIDAAHAAAKQAD